jgi:phosphatidylglycerophosphatase A
MQFRDKWVLFLATGGFVGKIPIAPGTFGSLWGIPICFWLSETGYGTGLFITAGFTLGAIWVAHRAEKLLGSKDAPSIVIDEIAGYMVTMLGLSFDMFTAVAGFIIFRLMDITKPFPIRRLETHLPGGAGVVLDDVAAGIYGNLALRALLFAWHQMVR